MKKKTRITFAVASFFLLCSFPSHAMEPSVFQKMMERIDSKEFEPVDAFLSEEENSLALDPEYHVILLNYAFAKRNSTVVIARGEPREGDISLQNKDTGEAVGFIRQGGDDIVVTAIEKTQKCLPAFENRLDIHLGIVAIAAAISRWDIAGNQLVDILATSKAIENKWEWGPVGAMQGEPKAFMLENVQSRVEQLFRSKDEVADRMLIRVSEAMIQHYPGVIYGYSNLGVIYLATGKYGLAEKYIKQALAIDPDDPVVKGNLKILNQRKNSSQRTSGADGVKMAVLERGCADLKWLPGNGREPNLAPH
jgi:tetratricopeptide (TPR) repeat protein